MKRKINCLTSEQKSRFPEFVKKWTDIGLCTEPANRKLAEEGIIEAYAIVGLKPPRIVWCGSPMSQGLTKAIVLKLFDKNSVGESVWDSVSASVWDSVSASVSASVWDSVSASVRNSVGDSVGESVSDSVGESVSDSVGEPVRVSVRDSVGQSVWDSVGESVRNSVRNSVSDSVRKSVGQSVWDSVGESVSDSVGKSVRKSVRDSVWDSVGESVSDSVGEPVRVSVRDSVGQSVWDSVGESVRNSVRNSVSDSVRKSVRDSVWASGYGQHDANWLAFYDFFSEVCGLVEETAKLSGLWKISKNAGWFLPHEKICWISERHSEVHKDDQGRLHNEAGPCVLYPDSWAIFAIHGVRVQPYVVLEPEKITVEDIESERNQEVKRVKIDRFGADKYLLASNAKKIHEDDFGILYKKDMDDDEPLVMVKVVNSTPEPDGTYKDYFLRVPPDMKRARQAVAWTFGVPENEYSLELQT